MEQSGYLPRFMAPEMPSTGEIGIAELAIMFGVSPRTLRFYEEKGLLNPRRDARQRYYDEHACHTMGVIHSCRETGMAVADIKELLDRLALCKNDQEAEAVVISAFEERVLDIDHQCTSLQSQKDQALELIQQCPDTVPERQAS